MTHEEITALGKQEIKQEIKQEKDAEGEEMLCVKAKTVREMYAANDRLIADHAGDEIEHDSATINDMLRNLFGSKCLPDENYSNVEKLEKNDEPKFKVGDTASYVCSPTLKHKCTVTKVMQNEHSGKWEYNVLFEWGKPGMWIPESDLEPYTEPAEEASPNVNISDIDIDELVAKGCVPDPAKQFDNILKDSFSKERRLTIAAQMMQGLICAPLIPGVDPNPPAEYLAQTAFRLADALMAEAEKGDDK